jgi:putative ABC transport system permease protein
VRGLLRGLRQRAGVSVGILLVATVAAAAATLGPAYDAAARTSILQDNLHDQVPVARTVLATNGGSVAGLADGLASQVNALLATQLGGAATVRRLFLPPVEAVLAQVSTRTGAAGAYQSPMTWRTHFCGHLTITVGTCPTAPGQILVSQSYARAAGVKPGATIPTTSGYGRLDVTGEYAVPSAGEVTSDPYWQSAQCDDFLVEDPCPTAGGGSGGSGPSWDALFASEATFSGAPASEQGDATLLDTLNSANVRASDINALTSAVNELNADPTLESDNISVTSSIPQLTGQVTSEWQTLDVPVFLISLQLLLLAWLLLFLIATDASEARAVEVALAKLRGYGRARIVAFGISEPAILLLTAFPVGALLGWAATAGLTRFLLRPGTPATLPWLAIAAAAVSTLGGFVAILIAARRTTTRPVIEQWQRTARDAGRRGWLLDGVLLTCAVAGLAELIIGGNVSSTRSGSLGLLVPGLLGLAVAVVASRALPAGCALAFALTRRRGGTGLFLAVRHIARRPGGTRTTIVLTASFALATFAIAAYAVQSRNIDRVAAAQTGAAGVMVVTPPEGRDLATIVDKIDPGGTQAATVDRYAGAPANGSNLLAVDPARWARVAQWMPGFFIGDPLKLAQELQPTAAAPVILPAGSTAARLTISGLHGAPSAVTLTLWMVELGSPSGGQTPVSLGPLRNGTLSVAVSDCPCEITMVSIDTNAVFSSSYVGGLTLSGLSALMPNRQWQMVEGATTPGNGWSAGAEYASGCGGTTGQVSASAAGPGATASGGTGAGSLDWSFNWSGPCSPALIQTDTPVPLPALVATGLTSGTGGGNISTLGLDGQNLVVRPVAVAAAVPGAPAVGIVVDRTYAQRAAFFTMSGLTDEEVWTAPGAEPSIKAKLVAAGVTIDSVTTTADARTVLSREGPALASVLFLAAALAAALLAGGAAVLALYQAGRRRRLEYAALLAGRVPRGSLRSSVLIEQTVVLGFGIVTGVAAGAASAALVLRNVPEFATPPVSPPLIYSLPLLDVGGPLLACAVVLAVAATLAALAVIRAARPDLLRQGQA